MPESKSDGRPKPARAAEAGANPSKSRDAAKSDPVKAVILEKLKQNPNGLHFAEIVELLTSENEYVPVPAISKALAEIMESETGQVEKPSRGFYRYRAGDKELPSEKSGEVPLTDLEARYSSATHRPRVPVKDRIVAAALEVLMTSPSGLSTGALITATKSKVAASRVAIERTVSRLPKLAPEKVEKPYWGFYRYRRSSDGTAVPRGKDKVREPSGSEKDFYRPFAEWLLHETEECTKAVPLGASSFGTKWGTPDVIGILQKKRTDPVEFPPEIVSAEIKTDDRDLITAFGQACAYKLFSHKSYLVVPKSASREDIDRLDSLCLVLGIGLVLFNNASPLKPDFEIRVRPAKHAPDMYYVNANLKRVPELCE